MENGSLFRRVKRVLFGAPRDLFDPKIFHNVSLVAFFAWVGLGADGISSSCYGPEEAFLALGSHAVLAIFIAVMSVATIFIISGSYAQIIEAFPSGGGGYIVASKLLGEKAGVVSGSALVIDYVLTITISIASGADALFSILSQQYLPYKIWFVTSVILLLIWMNLRGIKESVAVFTPIFMVFMLTHIPLLLYAMLRHVPEMPAVASEVSRDFHSALGQMGWIGLGALLMRAFSMGGGTFTGIEAISNSMQTLREPRVQTGKKAMAYMAFSLSFLAGGILLGYLLYKVAPVPGKTLNAILFDRVVGELWQGSGGKILLAVVLGSETALLFIAAQTGIIDGPQVLSNMALDYYAPRRFAHLSERLVRKYGVVFMGGMALLMLYISAGSVKYLVIMYSINVFLTFTLSQFGMVVHWWKDRATARRWRFGMAMNGIGFLLTAVLLCLTVWFKFPEGGWVTLLITGAFVAVSLGIRRHYRVAQESLRRLDDLLLALPSGDGPRGAGADGAAAGADGGRHGIRLQRARDARLLLHREAIPRDVPELRLHLRGGRRHERVQGSGGGREPCARPPGATREVRGVRQGARLLLRGAHGGGHGRDRDRLPSGGRGRQGLPQHLRLRGETRLQGGESHLPPAPQPDRVHGAETACVRGPADDRPPHPGPVAQGDFHVDIPPLMV